MTHVDETYLPLEGGRIFVKTWTPEAPSSKAPVLMLHDSLGCVDLWRGFPEALCERLGRKIIAYDRLGFGRSDARTERPSLRFVEEEAEEVFPRLHVALRLEGFALLGHSVGGGMAANIAARHPEACEALVTVSAQAFVEERTVAGIERAKRQFEGPAQFARLSRYHGDKAPWVLDAWTGTWLSPAFADWSLFEVLPQVACPVLAVHGESDEYGSHRFPESIAERTSGPASALILENCGHIPHREQPEVLLDAVGAFLADLYGREQKA